MFARRDPEPATDPEPTAEPEPKNRLPVSLFGTKEEKLARFGPPINRKDLPPRSGDGADMWGTQIYGGAKDSRTPLGVIKQRRRNNGTHGRDQILDRFVAQKNHPSPRSQPGRSDEHIPLDEFDG
jgi:hypothetical protein